MKAIIKGICLMAVLGSMLAGNLFAQVNDRVPVSVRYPDANKLRDLQADRAYQYGTEAPPSDSALVRFLRWLFGKLGEFSISESYSNVWQYVILAAIAAFAFYLLLKAEVMGSLFGRRAKESELDYETISEDIHEINFETSVATAIEKRNYRLAVRLLYLQTLKRLADAELIQYKIDKTNQQYVYELANSPQQADFAQLTRQFEFVWYGDFPVDAERFDAVQAQFWAFGRSLSLTKEI